MASFQKLTGFEDGNFDETTALTGSAVIISSGQISGTFSLRCFNPGAAQPGARQFVLSPALSAGDPGTILSVVRFRFRLDKWPDVTNTSLAGIGGGISEGLQPELDTTGHIRIAIGRFGLVEAFGSYGSVVYDIGTTYICELDLTLTRASFLNSLNGTIRIYSNAGALLETHGPLSVGPSGSLNRTVGMAFVGSRQSRDFDFIFDDWQVHARDDGAVSLSATRTHKVFPVVAIADGSPAQWSGTFADVDELPFSFTDLDVQTEGISGETHKYAHKTVSQLGLTGIEATKVTAMLKASSGTPSHAILIGDVETLVTLGFGFAIKVALDFLVISDSTFDTQQAGVRNKTGTETVTLNAIIMQVLAGVGEIEFTDDEAATGETVGISWVEFTDSGSALHVWSHLDLADPSTYFGGFKEARILTWDRIVRSLSDWRGQFEGVSFGFTMADADRVIRGLLAEASTKFFRGRPLVIRAISDANRRLLKTPRTMVRGLVKDYSPLPDLKFKMRGEDRFTHEFGSKSEGVGLPRRLLRIDEFPDIDQALIGKPEPIVYGSLNDFTAPHTAVTTSVTGVSAVQNAQPGSAPTGFSGSLISGGTGASGWERYYIIGAVVSTRELPQPQAVRLQLTDALRSIRLTWNSIAGATAIQVYTSHHASFNQHSRLKDSAILAGSATQYDDTFVAPNEDRVHQLGTDRYLSLRLNLTYYVWALVGVNQWSNAGSSSLIITPIHQSRRGPNDQDRSVTISWNAFSGALGYRIIRRTSWYSDWRPSFNRQYDVGPGTLSVTDDMTGTTDNSTATVPTAAAAPTAPTSLTREAGVVPAIPVGSETISGTKYQRLIIAGHAVKAVEDIFISRADNQSASGEPDDDKVFDKIRDSDYGDTWFAPGKTGYLLGTVFKDINSRRYTIVYTTANPVPKKVLCNVLGIEDIGDGTGTLITDIIDQYEHALENWVYGNYLSGAWLAAPTFLDDPALSQIDSGSFAAAKLISQSRFTGGYFGQWILGGDGSIISIREWIARMNLSADVDSGFNRNVQYFISMFAPTAVASKVIHDDLNDIFLGSFVISDKAEELFNVFPYAFRRDHVDNDFGVVSEVRNAQSITDYGQEAIAPLVELWMIRDEAVALDIMGRRLLRFKDPVRDVAWTISLQGLSVEIGDIVRITHPEGVGSAGWTTNPIRVTRHGVSPLDYSVELEGEDIRNLYRETIILGDESILPSLWANADENERFFGYLGTEVTNKFSDSEAIKRLR